MKKITSIIAAILLLAGCFLACSPKQLESKETTIEVVTTIFPLYDWVKNVAGDAANVNVTMLLDSGVDLHSFQPTAADVLKVSTCDMFLYVGGESDEWVEDALKEAANENMVVVNLLKELGDLAKEEELVEGMEDEGHEEEEEEYDEHVWLSLRNAALLVERIGQALCRLDGDNAPAYVHNAAAYQQRLLKLDERYAQAVDQASVKTILFGDRFPFRYLADDYGLSYYAAFAGCSAETEASFATVAFLAEKVRELSLPAILTIEGNDCRLAQTIAATAGAEDIPILTLNSMQSVTVQDVSQGVSYLAIMEKNLDVLQAALNQKG